MPWRRLTAIWVVPRLERSSKDRETFAAPIGAVPSRMRMTTVSVVIPSHDRPALLREAIESVCRQTRPVCEVVIVDDGSSPPVDAAALSANLGAPLRVLRNDRAQGLAWCRHQGVEAVGGDYVVQLDDDDLFAPELVERCAGVLDAEPDIDAVFIGVRGFGAGAEHFNHVHPSGVAKVIADGEGQRREGGVVRFGRELAAGLLRRVPMPFQRVMARRETWHRIHALRLACYRRALALPSDAAARERIRGTLRDSEWAIYAAFACAHLALVDCPLYLQRCEGQGTSSLPAMRRRHMEQMIDIRHVLHSAAASQPELRPWQPLIRHTLAQARFDAAYELTSAGELGLALSHWRASWSLEPRPHHLRLLLRWLQARLVQPVGRRPA